MEIKCKNTEYTVRNKMLKNALGAILLLSTCSIATDAFGMYEHDFGNGGKIIVRIGGGNNHQYQAESPKEQPPKNFRGSLYLSLHPDLQQVAKRKKDPTSWARRQYMAHGRYEGRHYLPRDFNGETYISLYPDLQSASAKKKPHKRESWGREHYARHGYKEGRSYSAGAQPLAKLRYYREDTGAEITKGNYRSRMKRGKPSFNAVRSHDYHLTYGNQVDGNSPSSSSRGAIVQRPRQRQSMDDTITNLQRFQVALTQEEEGMHNLANHNYHLAYGDQAQLSYPLESRNNTFK